MKRGLLPAMTAASMAAGIALLLFGGLREGGPAPAPEHGPGPGAPPNSAEPAAPSPAAREAAPAEPTAAVVGRTARWKVVLGECGVPPDGSAVRIARWDGEDPREGRMDGEWLVAGGFPPEYGVWRATAGDGSLAHLFLPAVPEGPKDPVSFVRPRTVEIVLRDEDGNLVEAAGVGLGNHGRDRRARVVPLEGGRAVYDGLFPSVPGPGFCLLDDWNREGDGYSLGVVDLSKGDLRLEQLVPRPVPVVLRVRVDGKQALPEPFLLLADLQPAGRRDWDAIVGELRFWVRPRFPGRDSVGLLWGAAGYEPAQATPVARRDPSDGTYRAELDLRTVPRLTLLARIAGTVPEPGITIDGWGADGWGAIFTGHRPAMDGTLRVEGLWPGRYRIRDPATGVVSEAVDLSPESKAREVPLEVPPAATASGRVFAPEDVPWNQVRILVEGEGVDTAVMERPIGLPGYGVAGDLRFSVPVPADRTVTLRAWHPALAGAETKGPVQVRGGADGLVLRLVEERAATFRPVPKEASPFRALLFRGEPQGEPAHVLKVVGTGSIARFGGFEPGRYTVWIDSWRFASRILREVELGPEGTDLGVVRFEPGSTLAVRLRVPEGVRWPGFHASAAPVSGPGFARYEVASRDTREAVIRGLAAGRYRVSARTGVGQAEASAEIEVDGVTPGSVELELK